MGRRRDFNQGPSNEILHEDTHAQYRRRIGEYVNVISVSSSNFGAAMTTVRNKKQLKCSFVSLLARTGRTVSRRRIGGPKCFRPGPSRKELAIMQDLGM
jgi:hypothetical protein